MPDLPQFEKKWEYENGFYMTSNPERIAKVLAHWELYKKSSEVPGDIVEFGVFKGTSLIRLATFRSIDSLHFGKKIIAFDTFEEFPETEYENDKKNRNEYIKKAGDKSLTENQVNRVLEEKNLKNNVVLVKRDIKKTLPKYVKNHPEIRISLLHIDVDIYEPSVTIMKEIFEKVVKNGVVIFDDYGDFDGESTAVEEYIGGDYNLRSMPCGVRGAYLVK